MELEILTPENWKEFTENETAVLVLGKTGCQACEEWSAEIESSTDIPENVKIGKLIINQKGLLDFKKANSWLAEVDILPYNVLYQKGEVKKRYGGSGMERLLTRLSNL